MTHKRSLIALGRIIGAHGVRGDVFIETYTAEPRDIASYGPLSDSEGKRMFHLAARRETPKGVVAHIEGIDDRTAAEALKGVTLSLPRDRLPEPEEGAYYHADLVGLAAVDGEGRPFGRIVAVRNYGAGDLLEVEHAGSETTELVPFTAAVVPNVDLAAGRATIIMISGPAPRDNSSA